MGRARPILATLFGGLAITAAATASSGRPASGQACGEPYPPVYLQTVSSARNDPPPAIDAAPVSTSRLHLTTDPDFDGDGTPDHEHSGNEPAQATVRRPAGDLTFALLGERLDVALAGNLDGNPGQEIWVFVIDSTHERLASDAYVVPYETPGGTYDPADVGIRVAPGIPWPIPDWTGDAVADVLDIDNTVSLVSGTTRLLSGADIMAVGVPGDARSVTPIATIPGGAQALADFGGAAPAIVTADDGADTGIVTRVFDSSLTTTFTTGASPLIGGMDIRPGNVTALSGASGRFVTVSGSNRSGTFTYWWSLDDPCTALSAAADVPASPVGAAPRFTG